MTESNPFAARPRVYDSEIPTETEVADTTEQAQAAADVAPVKTEKVSEVPNGSIKEVKDWVGDDTERAQVALDAENEGNQRSTLITYLEGLLSD